MFQRVKVVGRGRVGSAVAARLAERGHSIVEDDAEGHHADLARQRGAGAGAWGLAPQRAAGSLITRSSGCA